MVETAHDGVIAVGTATIVDVRKVVADGANVSEVHVLFRHARPSAAKFLKTV